MKKLLLTCFIVWLGSTAFSQSTTISAAQYIITIQSTQPDNYPGYYNVSYSRQYSLYDQANTLTNTLTNYGYGQQTQTLYVTASLKPDRINARHIVNYQYEYCETYDPNCGDFPAPERQSGGNNNSMGTERLVYECGNCWYQTNSFNDYYQDIAMRYPNFDTTFTGNNGNSVRITVAPAGDNNYNLPSSDNIVIQAANATGSTWEYQILGQGTDIWNPVPAGLIQAGGAQALLSGQSLLGSSWMNYINKTILFRVKKSDGTTSNILIYTHRLSSPKIVNVQEFQNPCYGFDTAYIKVKFDRQLLDGEKINIFLKDTAFGLDYSALNLTNANIDAATMTYTWPRELVEGGYKISLIGKYNDVATYTGSPSHFAMARIKDPELVRFYLSQSPVLCFDGNSGKITVAAKGGVGNYKYELVPIDSTFRSVFTNFTNPVYNNSYGTTDQVLAGFREGAYKVKVRDGNNCMNRDSIGRETSRAIRVKQPSDALGVTLLNVSPITASNLSNGAIKIRLAGGTPETEGYYKYNFEWRDSASNNLISLYSVDTTGGKFETTISNLSNGTYKFKAWDANYNRSAQAGCFVLLYIKITRPNPLTVAIAVDSVIKCNGNTNGKLKALAAGGIPVTTDSTIYNFTWYKLVNGNYVNLNVNDSLLRNAGAGQYKAEVRDKYNNLQQSSLFTFTEPALITATPSFASPSCYFKPDGTMSVTATGGTAPYKYEWSNGGLTQTVTGVAGGNYLVVIKDANQCQATRTVTVTTPAKINVVKNITAVGCSGTASGAIQLAVSGGAGGYSYAWNNGSTGATANNLAAGRYWYTVTDALGCWDTDTLQLDAPEAYTVTAGPDRKICSGQTIQLKVQTSATAQPLTTTWSGPQGISSGSSLNINQSGTYIATVSNSSGCQKKDTVIVAAENAAVNTSFTVSTQVFAGENTTLVNISPALQDSAIWILPPGAGINLISQSKAFCELKFADTGRYVVGIKAYYSNGCIDEKYKEINVLRKENFTNLGSQGESFLKQFNVYPNPTTGNFTLNLLFNNVTVARVRVINIITNAIINDRILQGAASYTEQYNISGIYPAGNYVVLIETAKGNFVHKLIKQ